MSEENFDEKQVIIDSYFEYVKQHHELPTNSDMDTIGISRSKLRHHFHNITKLHEYVKANHKEELEKYVLFDDTIFTRKKLNELSDNLKNYNRFVITTAVSGKRVNQQFYQSILNYCAFHNAKLLILPCMDKANRSKGISWQFPPILRDETFVFNDNKSSMTEDVRLNDNIFISSILTSAKQINPLTGLSRIGQRNGTFVYASPKQSLEYVATSSSKNRYPHALMTTGAMTVPDYQQDMYMSQRTSYIAEVDHVTGAIIVEIKDDKRFFFRQIQADEHGSFIDLGVRYGCDSRAGVGSTEEVKTDIVLGDWHSGDTDSVVAETTQDICKTLKVSDIYLHDFFNGHSISHHDLGDIVKRAKKVELERHNLEEEVLGGAEDLNFISSFVSGDIYHVMSNHDEWITRYLSSGMYVQDPENHYYALGLARAMLEGKNVIRYAYEQTDVLKHPEKIKWLERDEEWKVGGVEMSAHGDIGSNGARKASLNSLEKAYGQCVVGHTHSAAIHRGVYRVGTSSRMDLDYKKGPSSWTHTHCLVYPNGSRQLINIIEGEWKL